MSEKTREEVAAVVRELIGDKRQYQFSELTGIDQSTLSAILNCHIDVPLSAAKKLATYSGKPLTDFIR